MAVIKFCGASVTSFNCRLGWGNNQSSIDINVVEDTVRGGDFFNPPLLGQPCYFTFGPSFKFWGLLQNWNKQSSTSGLNMYTVSVKDPRDLLESAQVITGAYNGSIFGVPNILNCYGYWENQLGFGGANVNEGGMLWTNVLSAIQTMTNTAGGTSMGGPLQYMGINYAVDLSLLPVPPPFYRVPGGPTMTLLNLIQQICDDGGVEFFVELDPGTTMPIIRVYTVSRYQQPPFGTITQITNQNWGGTVVRSSNGLTLRNDVTTHFLIGGQEQTIYETNGIQPYWGYDLNGAPIDNIISYIPGLGYCNSAYINVTEIADVFNRPTQYYFLTDFEMRFAAQAGTGAWEAYVAYQSRVTRINQANLIGPLGLRSMLAATGGVAGAVIDTVADVTRALTSVGDAASSQLAAQAKLQDFIKKIADNWYGKKFWVSLPFVSAYEDPESLVTHYSHDISDGGWLPEGQSPLNLQAQNLLRFQQADGRYVGLAVYSAGNIDLRTVSERDSALQLENNSFYSKIAVDKDITIWPQTGIPAALVTILSPPKVEMATISGDGGLLDMVIAPGVTRRIIQNLRAFGALNIQAVAPYKMPTLMAVPLKSNVTTYGPWYLAGAPGKTLVEVASNLTPWEYGGTDFMQLAANARVTSAATFMTMAEQGSIELMGMPLTSLGRTLIAGGPEVTNVEVRMGGPGQGLTTSYQFATFTQTHLNRFMANAQERIKRMGATQNEIRTAALISLAAGGAIGATLFESAATSLRRYPTWELAWATPHPVIIASALQSSGTAGIRLSAATTDPQEGWGGIGPTFGDDTLYQNSALTSLSAIVRPFANSQNRILLPKVRVAPTGISGLSVANINPYVNGNNDFEYLSSGNTAGSGQFLTKQGIDWNSVRGIGYATPAIAVGWGYRIDGTFIPPNPSTGHQAGPIDLIYDHNRGCWTSHDFMFGYIDRVLPGNGGSVNMTICDGNNLLNVTQTVYNFYQGSVAASSYITAGYFPYSNKWQVISADCASGVQPPPGVINIG